MAFSADGRVLAAGGADGRVHLWDGDGQAAAGHPRPARRVAAGRGREPGRPHGGRRRRRRRPGSGTWPARTSPGRSATAPSGPTAWPSPRTAGCCRPARATTILVWDLRSGRRTPIDTGGPVEAIAALPDGRVLSLGRKGASLWGRDRPPGCELPAAAAGGPDGSRSARAGAPSPSAPAGAVRHDPPGRRHRDLGPGASRALKARERFTDGTAVAFGPADDTLVTVERVGGGRRSTRWRPPQRGRQGPGRARPAGQAVGACRQGRRRGQARGRLDRDRGRGRAGDPVDDPPEHHHPLRPEHRGRQPGQLQQRRPPPDGRRRRRHRHVRRAQPEADTAGSRGAEDAALTPDGKTLAAGGVGSVIALYDLDSRQLVGQLRWAPEGLSVANYGVEISPDGRWLVEKSQAFRRARVDDGPAADFRGAGAGGVGSSQAQEAGRAAGRPVRLLRRRQRQRRRLQPGRCPGLRPQRRRHRPGTGPRPGRPLGRANPAGAAAPSTPRRSTSLAFDPTGDVLAVGYPDRIELRDARTTALLQTFRTPGDTAWEPGLQPRRALAGHHRAERRPPLGGRRRRQHRRCWPGPWSTARTARPRHRRRLQPRRPAAGRGRRGPRGRSCGT